MRPILRGALLSFPGATVNFAIIPYLLRPFGPFDGLTKFAGVPLIVVGAILCLYVVWKFAFVGQGTPAPFDPPKLLLTEGLYRRVRNPMYMGAVTIAFGEAMLLGSFGVLVYAALMWASSHLFVVYYEEPKLRVKYGRAYEEYCSRAGRWVPRLYSHF